MKFEYVRTGKVHQAICDMEFFDNTEVPYYKAPYYKIKGDICWLISAKQTKGNEFLCTFSILDNQENYKDVKCNECD